MGLSKDELNRRKNDTNVKNITICNSDGDKPYVFISYKSDDWEVVLKDIVYRLVTEYGLNVYFDGSFDDHNAIWTNQFTGNMESSKCRGVLAFIDNKYATSYATLLELMYSQTEYAGKLHVVTINLEELMDYNNDEGDENTGLGTFVFRDGTKNNNADTEKSLFDEAFEELSDKGKLDKYKYKKNKYVTIKNEKCYLNKRTCSRLFSELLKNLGVNENKYDKNDSRFLEQVKNSIVDACGEAVFSKPQKPPLQKKDNLETVQGEKSNYDPVAVSETSKKPAVGTISLTDFFKKYNNQNFKKNTFKKYRLVGLNGYEKYTTGYCESASDIAWSFITKLIEEYGKNAIDRVNSIHSDVKNPIFITTQKYDSLGEKIKVRYKKLTIAEYTDYYMYSGYSQYDWLNYYMKARMMDFGLPIEKFVFEYSAEETVDMQRLPEKTTAEKDAPSESVSASPVSVNFSAEPTDYIYSIFGKEYHASSRNQSKLMYDVFVALTEKYPEKADELTKNSSVARAEQVQNPNDRQKAYPTYFRTCQKFTVNGQDYYVGSSYGIEAKLAQIYGMIKVCGLPKDTFVLISAPDKIKRNQKDSKFGIDGAVN